MPSPSSPPTSPSRHLLAQRIQLLLEREIDHLILVERLLTDAHYARDVLLVCDALSGTLLPGLAAQFRAASPEQAEAGTRGVPGHAAQANAWGQDTSGFGFTQPPPWPDQPEPLAEPARVPAEASAHSRPATVHPPGLAGPPGPPGPPPTQPPGPERRRGWLDRWRDR